MYAAKKYQIDGLADRCKDFLDQAMSTANVCTILSQCMIYDEQELSDKCIDFVSDDPEGVLESDDFLDSSSEGLHRLVSSDALSCVAAVDIYNACVKWAKRRRESQTAVCLRDILGSSLYEVPFRMMSAKDLSCITDENPGILSHKEQVVLFKYITDPTENRLAALVSLGFNVRRTKVNITRNRFLQRPSGGYYSSHSPNSICFTVSKSVTFVGITMYGMKHSGFSDNVSLQLYNEVTTECLSDSKKHMAYTGTDEPIQLPADKHVMLSPNVKYRVVLHTTSDVLYYYGIHGQYIISTWRYFWNYFYIF